MSKSQVSRKEVKMLLLVYLIRMEENHFEKGL